MIRKTTKTILTIGILSAIIISGQYFPVGNIFSTQPAKAAGPYNMSGWIWSENIGWISLNCANQDVCGTSDYGLNIDETTGELSGSIWSETIGWISFDKASTGAPPAAPFNGAETYIAKLDPISREISGWARALANGDGWDGWIKLRGTGYGVSMSGTDLIGWAWSDNVVGWISFNCSNENVCGTSDYGGTSSFSAPNETPSVTLDAAIQTNSCQSGASVILPWSFSDPNPDDFQSAYQIQVDNNSDFSSTEIDPGKVVSPSDSYAILGGTLQSGTTYYWRVMVWDNYDSASAWTDSSSFTVTNPPHAYPTGNFSWLPLNPLPGQETIFTDLSSAFGGATIVDWDWSIPDADYVGGTNSSSQNPRVEFSSSSNKNISLTVTDSDGLTCTVTKVLSPRLPLPSC